MEARFDEELVEELLLARRHPDRRIDGNTHDESAAMNVHITSLSPKPPHLYYEKVFPGQHRTPSNLGGLKGQ